MISFVKYTYTLDIFTTKKELLLRFKNKLFIKELL